MAFMPCGLHFMQGRERVKSLASACFAISAKKWRRHPDSNWGMKVLQTLALPLGYGAFSDFVLPCGMGEKFPRIKKWSGKRDSNSRHSPWQGDALPLSHSRIRIEVVGGSYRARTCDPLLVRQMLSQLS